MAVYGPERGRGYREEDGRPREASGASKQIQFALLSLLLLGLVVGSTALLPPTEPPDGELLGFTMDNRVPIARFYVDDTDSGKQTWFSQSREELEQYSRAMQRTLSLFKARLIPHLQQNSKSEYRDKLMYQTMRTQKGHWLYFAVMQHYRALQTLSYCREQEQWAQSADKLRAADKPPNLRLSTLPPLHPSGVANVCVFGSSNPHIEAMLLALGTDAGVRINITTIEYNKLTLDHEWVTTISSEGFDALYSSSSSSSSSSGSGVHFDSFDFCVADSSFDHDGLGRYGDPVTANGDLKAMRNARLLIKPGGVLFLTVPIGPDLVVFNTLRRYGPLRLPLLTQGWDVLDRYAWHADAMTGLHPAMERSYAESQPERKGPEGEQEVVIGWRKSYEPVLVLQKPLVPASATSDSFSGSISSTNSISSNSEIPPTTTTTTITFPETMTAADDDSYWAAVRHYSFHFDFVQSVRDGAAAVATAAADDDDVNVNGGDTAAAAMDEREL